MRFEVASHYTREQVQNILAVPAAQRDGNWDTGYNRFQNELFVFCNVGMAGRTGHDHGNQWEGDELVWYAKAGTHIGQHLIRQIASGDIPVHLFWRPDSRQVQFTYAGVARPLSIDDTRPVRIRWAFSNNHQKSDQPNAGANGDSAADAETVTLGELVGEDGRLFAKSEFAPVHDGWPAVSFSSRKIASDFSVNFRRGRDFVLYVGTGDPSTTEAPEHRRRVLSAVTCQPNTLISTESIVPRASWVDAVKKWGTRWEWSIPVIEAWELTPFPEAKSVMPHTYARLGQLQSLGRCVAVANEDLPSLLQCHVVKKSLALEDAVRRVVMMNPTDPDLKRSISNLAIAIQERIALSGKEQSGLHPIRSGLNLSDLIEVLNRKWIEQNGCCHLCNRSIPLKANNRLLKMSVDRIDSGSKIYDTGNVHLTHLGCNLAKNDVSMEQWHEFLAHIRDKNVPLHE